MAAFALEIANGDWSSQTLGALLQSVADNDILAPIVTEFLVDAINENVPGINMTVDPEYSSEFLGAIAGAAGSLITLFDPDYISHEEGCLGEDLCACEPVGLDFTNPSDILEVLGGLSILEALVQINEDSEANGDGQAVLIDLSGLASDFNDELGMDDDTFEELLEEALLAMLGDSYDGVLTPTNIMALFGF